MIEMIYLFNKMYGVLFDMLGIFIDIWDIVLKKIDKIYCSDRMYK